MRIPYVIPKNIITVYEPSRAALTLVGELARDIFPEDFNWDANTCPPLVTLCIRVLARNFENRNCYNDVIHDDKAHLLELLSTSLPLELTVPLIDVEDYWHRCYRDKFGNYAFDKLPGFSWKVKFLERYMTNVIEQLQPQYNDEDEIEPLTLLIGSYITKLTVTQLQAWKPPLTMSAEDVPEVYPTDHINFLPIFKKLQNIVELDIVYTVHGLGQGFDWHQFKVSVDDCKRLGIAILQLKLLKVFRLHRSKIEDSHVRALVQQLVKNVTITELDLSHCYMGDNGALCIGKLMTVHPALMKLNLANNFIGKLGGEGIGFALTQETCCPLEVLDLRLNPLGHDGTMGILKALVRQNTINIKELSLAACLFEDETSLRVAQMLGLNQSIERLNISNNWFTKDAYDRILEVLPKNMWIKRIDMRETDIPNDVKEKINKHLTRNRSGISEPEMDVVEEEERSEEIDYELQEIMFNNDTMETPKDNVEDD